jgi:hypothetical protein
MNIDRESIVSARCKSANGLCPAQVKDRAINGVIFTQRQPTTGHWHVWPGCHTGCMWGTLFPWHFSLTLQPHAARPDAVASRHAPVRVRVGAGHHAVDRVGEHLPVRTNLLARALNVAILQRETRTMLLPCKACCKIAECQPALLALAIMYP